MNSLTPYIKDDNEHLQPLVENNHRNNVADDKFAKEFSKQVKKSVIEMNSFFKLADINTDLP